IGRQNGKVIQKSFTADTKREAEYLALTYEDSLSVDKNVRLKEALLFYADNRKNVLSASTYREYLHMAERYKCIEDLRVSRISPHDIDRWLNEYSKDHSPKTVRNSYAFLCSVLKYFDVKVGSHKLPQVVKKTYRIPSDADIKVIIEKCQYSELRKAIMLGAFGMMRRSEISALEWEDIEGNVIHIHSAMVKGVDGYQKKTTKNVSSDRYITVPDFVVAELQKDRKDKPVDMTPSAITKRFLLLMDKIDMPYTFHSLRHWGTTTLMYNHLPSKFIQDMGGWSTPKVMNEVYTNTINDYQRMYSEKAMHHFENVFHGNS
ncbi:MAG: site-specific integrase, partial [Bacteroidaceae bacterium]|nr:site-specific integrase [Bacteroidaceae bacterium]